MTNVNAFGFLDTATKLAGFGAGPGRPALADLRRATSTAYYALFHQIIQHGAMDFAPAADKTVLATVARWYTHTGIRIAADAVITGDRPVALAKVRKQDRNAVMALRSAAGASPGQALPKDLVVVADTFVNLQAARHSADYDGNYDPVRAVTMNHVIDAEGALNSTWSMWNAPAWTEPGVFRAYQSFLRLALLYSGGPKPR